jgi:hypothetical protein
MFSWEREGAGGQGHFLSLSLFTSQERRSNGFDGTVLSSVDSVLTLTLNSMLKLTGAGFELSEERELHPSAMTIGKINSEGITENLICAFFSNQLPCFF